MSRRVFTALTLACLLPSASLTHPSGARAHGPYLKLTFHRYGLGQIFPCSQLQLPIYKSGKGEAASCLSEFVEGLREMCVQLLQAVSCLSPLFREKLGWI